MNQEIPPEVAKAIALLRNEAKEKNRLADELYRNFTGGDDPTQSTLLAGGEGVGPKRDVPSLLTVEALITYLKDNGGRPNHLARHFRVTEDRINELIKESAGRLVIKDWRGWVKIGKSK